VKLIGAIKRHSAGTSQPYFLLLCADEFKVHVIIERHCLLCAEIVGHGFKQSLGVRFIGRIIAYNDRNHPVLCLGLFIGSGYVW